MKINIQIYILSRNRPLFLKLAINSALNQNHSQIKFEIIVSDNSDNENVSKMMQENYTNKNIRYIRRDRPLRHIDHMNLVVSELNSEYSVIFHDDDILHPDYLNTMSSFFNQSDVVAFGCNAMNFYDNKLDSKNVQNSKLRIKNLSSTTKFYNEKDFLETYLPGNDGNAPFPSYIYRTKFLKQAMLKVPVTGKRADVSILSSLLNYGTIVWIEKPLMYYRIHVSNDSNIEEITSSISLFNFMKKKGVGKNSIKLQLFKVMFMINWISQQGNIKLNISNRRYRVILLFLLLKSMKLLIRINFWKLVLKRLFR